MPTTRAARLLSAPDLNNEFKFIYIPRRGRIPVHEIRRCLRSLDIPQSRILHVSFPARHVVGLLINAGFEPEIKSILTAHAIQLSHDFNPCSGTILEDPAYKNMAPLLKDNEARGIHATRCARIAASVPRHCRSTVASSFMRQGWMSLEDWAEATTVEDPNRKFRDDYMEEDSKAPGIHAQLQ